MRDILIELIEQGQRDYYNAYGNDETRLNKHLADHLLANGVVVPLCNVGDKVYKLWSVGKYGKSVSEFVVTSVSQIMVGVWVVKYQKQARSIYHKTTRYQCSFDDFGKTIFLSREEAEAKLKEGKG